MKRIFYGLPVFSLLVLGACTLRMSPPPSPTPIVLSTDVPVQTNTAVVQTEAAVAAAPTESPPTASPTIPATSTPQNTPTATPKATATPAGFDPTAVYGPPTYQNPMDTANYWEWAPPETNTLPNNERIHLHFDGGELQVTGKKPQFSTWWFSSHYLHDAYQQLTFNTEECTDDDIYGMILRGPSHLAGVSYGYVVYFTCDGRFGVSRLNDASPWDIDTVLDSVPASAINTGAGAENVLGVNAVGDTFTVYANGTKVGEFQDDEFLEGRMGVFVRAAKPGNYTYRVTDLAYWDLSEDE